MIVREEDDPSWRIEQRGALLHCYLYEGARRIRRSTGIRADAPRALELAQAYRRARQARLDADRRPPLRAGAGPSFPRRSVPGQSVAARTSKA